MYCSVPIALQSALHCRRHALSCPVLQYTDYTADCTTLHCTADCTVLHCSVPIALQTAVHYTALQTVLYCTAVFRLHCRLHCTTLHCRLYCTALQCTDCTADCTTLHCTADCTVLHCSVPIALQTTLPCSAYPILEASTQVRGWSLADRRTPEKRPSRKLRQKTVVREAACTRTATWCCCWVSEVCVGFGPDALGGSDGTGGAGCGAGAAVCVVHMLVVLVLLFMLVR